MPYLVHHLLQSAARRSPDATAVIDGDRAVTYRELDERSNQVARTLAEVGVRRGDRVALYLEKSIESLVGVYAALKAGAAYVPLDPQAPPARLGYILDDAGARALLTGVEKADTWDAVCAPAARLETLVLLNRAPDDAPPPRRPAALPHRALLTVEDWEDADARPSDVATIECDLAYILYTSGSTGVPKGVMLTHRNALAFVLWAAGEFAITSKDRLSSHAPLHFDLSTFDLFAAAHAGAAVILVPPQVSVFPSQVRSFIESSGITVWYSVPSILTLLALRGGLEPGALPEMRVILFAGEAFPTKHLRRLTQLLPHVRFANLYGPTETNVCTWWEVDSLPEGDEPIPIGRAIANVDVFAVTDGGTPAGPGEVGELYVRGPTVMQGYLGDPARSATRLVADPFAEELQQRVYRTGDLVEPAADGTYRFLGRRDDQIKSRGYRIELGDVEAALYAHPAVVECAVVAVPDELVTNRLEAYVTSRAGVTPGELAAFCAQRIPGYMVPDAFHLADVLPRTSTGKVDRRALATRAEAPKRTP